MKKTLFFFFCAAKTFAIKRHRWKNVIKKVIHTASIRPNYYSSIDFR